VIPVIVGAGLGVGGNGVLHWPPEHPHWHEPDGDPVNSGGAAVWYVLTPSKYLYAITAPERVPLLALDSVCDPAGKDAAAEYVLPSTVIDVAAGSAVTVTACCTISVAVWEWVVGERGFAEFEAVIPIA
jgi:hypothetical protein